MTPQDFIAKWRNVELKERTASHSHFIDLCALLDVPDPITADPRGDWFTFEKGAAKTGGGEGWADVWRRDCFAWEYKGRRRDLDAAFTQLQRYAIALDNPPLLIVSDMDRIRIHTNWTNTVQKVHTIALEDLTDAAVRDRLRDCFLNPEALRPAKTRAVLTEEAAQRFADLAQRLRGRGYDAQAVAHFVNQLVFCMFAEDVGLLPGKMFERMIALGVTNPGDFQSDATTLFDAMKSRNGKVGFERVEWFNGGLFDSSVSLPLEKEDLEDLLKAAALDWSDIDPSILGTLFERGLDPDKRSQLGAHYTDRDKIMMIVGPVIVQPLLAEWAAVRGRIEALLATAPAGTKDAPLNPNQRAARARAQAGAEALHRDFLDRLRAFRVLDPACGSGNFLYLSLLALKDIEHRANLEAEALGLQREFPRIGPEAVLGIELNSYAAELARVSVWIGEIQWMRRNGFEAGRDPILRTLDTIECRDAVLGPDGGRADWPRADVVVGNPPFLGNKKMIGGLGEGYTRALRKAYPDVPGGVDLVCYWFARAWEQMQAGEVQRVGLVSTNSIRGGANRSVLKAIADGGRIFEAWSDEAWTVPPALGGRAATKDEAAVRVSMVCFDAATGETFSLNGASVGLIYADLSAATGGSDLTAAPALRENKGVAFQGPVKVGAFDVPGEVARDWLKQPLNPNGLPNSHVLHPTLNGRDITTSNSGRWLIDFRSLFEADAAMFEKPFQHVIMFVKPLRDQSNDRQRREYWWRLGRSGSEIKAATRLLTRAIFTPRVAKHRLYVWATADVIPDCQVVAIARDDDTTFGILHSRFHELWSLRMGTSLEDRPRYTPSTTFETFPFPEGLTPDIPATAYAADPRAQAIAAAAARLNALRENWLNPADLILRVPEVVPGYPDRILPTDEAAAKVLKTRTLTNLYNARPVWLSNAHAALDQAVAESYGWGDDWRAGMGDDAILARLFQLNEDRAAAQSTKERTL